MSLLALWLYHYFLEMQYQLIMGAHLPPRGSIKFLCTRFCLKKDLYKIHSVTYSTFLKSLVHWAYRKCRARLESSGNLLHPLQLLYIENIHKIRCTLIWTFFDLLKLWRKVRGKRSWCRTKCGHHHVSASIEDSRRFILSSTQSNLAGVWGHDPKAL